jgi:lipoprotein-anchoring transpeptidase ErfK/SrfK
VGACVLMFSAPVFAQAPTTDSATVTTVSEATTTSEATTSSAVTTSTPDTTTAPTTTARQPVLGPATAGGQGPARGEQIQLTPPPPGQGSDPWDPFLLPADSGSGRRAVYSKSQQTVWAIDDNNVVIKAHRVSGRQDPLHPSPGVYQVWSRSRYTFAINNPSITWGYMIRFATGGNGGNIGFHDIPIQYGQPVQTIAQLGQPLSGGCVRQAADDAVWMWNWADIGTVVVVTP